MELTDKQKNDLKRFSLILNSLNMEDGVNWFYQCYDGYFEPLNGPFYNGKHSDELGFLPESIEEIFETIKDNFDTGNFYNDYYDNENGILEYTLNAEKKELDVSYTYYTMINEDSYMEKNFSDFSNVGTGWRGNERYVKNLTNQNLVDELVNQYGDYCLVNYEGGGDSGWINNDVESQTGNNEMNGKLEDISYDLLELYYGGWEINEGSQGSIKYDFQRQTVEISHNQNVESDEEEHYMTLKF